MTFSDILIHIITVCFAVPLIGIMWIGLVELYKESKESKEKGNNDD